MKRHRISENFYLDEFVGPEVHKQYGASGIWFIDKQIVEAMQYLRTKSGKSIHVNNWIHGGDLDERGYRLPTATTGAKLSQHKAGRATDSNMDGLTVDEYFEFVMSHEKYLIERQLITTIENPARTKTWLHQDRRWTGLDHIFIVNP